MDQDKKELLELIEEVDAKINKMTDIERRANKSLISVQAYKSRIENLERELQEAKEEIIKLNEDIQKNIKNE